ncbi:autophagy protein 5 [Acarospora aff. strigata]|nr:autophagy protein 5 [Acarospora aff. strigata]
MAGQVDLSQVQKAIWNGSLPLEIRLSPTDCRIYEKSDRYLIQYPRLSYLPLILPRLHAFFKPDLINPDVLPHEGWFSFEGVPLKWHYPVGLLYDLFSGATPTSSRQEKSDKVNDDIDVGENRAPWRLKLHFTEWPDEQLVRLDKEGKFLHDAFINSVKEADFVRNGTAKGIMSLSKDDSTQLWKAVEDHKLPAFNSVNQKLLHAQGGALRNVPVRIYLPSSAPAGSDSEKSTGSLRVVQSLVTPLLASREQRTLGHALNELLPSLFPSRRTAVLARAVLHGAMLPLTAPVEEIMRAAAYADGWVHLSVVMLG